MKTKLLWVAACCLPGLWTHYFAQELIKTKVPQAMYKNAGSSLLPNQQKVAKVYGKIQEVFTLDFSQARTKAVSAELKRDAGKTVSESEFVEYSNDAAIRSLLAQRPEALTVHLPYKNEILVIDLVQADLFGDNFRVNSNNPEMVSNVKTGLYYQGTIRGEQTVVGFNFFEDEFNAMISTNRPDDHLIETGRMENHGRTHIIYSDDDLLVDVFHSCGSEALAQYQHTVDQLAAEDHSAEANEKATYKCVTYFWETSYNLYQSKGTTQAVTNYMTSLFNNFQVMYNNEQIGSKLNQLYIWTSADSYNNSLDNFSANRSGFGANLATLFSTTGGGGVAWLDVVCGSNEYYKHGFCGSVGSSFSNVPNYSWPVNVTVHEVGHNLGSPHTHACSWTGGAIDGCGPTAGYSEGCTGPLPTNGGTVMSYCHLVSSVGMNLSLGFGTQPGNLIRSRVNSCITLTCDETGNTGGGGNACATAYEPNETQAAAAAITSGTAISAAISSATDVDYFKITTSGNTNNTFTLAGPSGVDYDMVIYNSAGTQIGAGTGSTASETVTLSNQAAGTYAIKIFGYNGANSTTCYSLTATAVANTSCATAYEPNETSAAAATIPLATSISAAISSSTDNDYYKVSVTTAGTHAFNLAGPSGVDFDMTIFNSAGTQIGSGAGSTATESVSLSGLAVGTYTIRLFGYNGANSTSCYTLNVARTGASVADMSGSDAYTIWPNPATEKLTVESSRTEATMSIEILDVNGQLLSSHQAGSTTTLDVAQLTAGVYFIRITSAGTAATQLKFIKQ